ncbi:MAG TPA: hypothetical protein PLN52_12995, partial [Opitutaceae bacterium]|nr:hypothetical protein [Opitutaceae bacterium]
ARRAGDPGADRLATALADASARQPAYVPWGGWDPFLDPLFNVNENTGRTESTPVLTFFIAEKARSALRTYLQNSRSMGVQALLRTREITLTTQFVPVTSAGGQTLDAVILMAALLYQGEHLSPPLQRDLRLLAETAYGRQDMGELETVYLDLLSLGKRLDWSQLSEMLRRTNDRQTLKEYAHLARVAPDDFALIYAAALFSGSADQVARYLLQFGKTGLEDLALAAREGQGAVQSLLRQQIPVNQDRDVTLGQAAQFALLHPNLALAVKWLGFFLAAFACLRGINQLVVGSLLGSSQGITAAVIAALCAILTIVFTEPFLFKAAPPSEFAFKLAVPVLATLSDPASLTSVEPTLAMDTSTLLSIGLFALLQVAWFLLCLRKISEISRSTVSPLVKLRLMENEENLFDGGLYLGIAGTATALVLQVLGVIQPNLLAAYSSNLFGIVCVALIKIRHVRPFKRQLILDGQVVATPPPTATVTF